MCVREPVTSGVFVTVATGAPGGTVTMFVACSSSDNRARKFVFSNCSRINSVGSAAVVAGIARLFKEVARRDDVGRDIARPGVVDHPGEETGVADAVPARLLRRVRGALLLEPEPDQEIAADAHQFPEDEQSEQ